MVRVKYTECRVMKTIDNDEDALRIIESVFEAIDAIRDRRKRPDRDSVSEYICTRNGLDKERADDVLYEMLLSGAIYTKTVKGKDSFFICNKVRTGIQSQISRMCEHKESSSVHSAVSSDNPTQPSYGLVNPSPSHEAQENFVIPASEDQLSLTSHYSSDVNVDSNSFIASLTKMALPDWSDNVSNKCTEISKLAETIVLLNNQLHFERKRCDELKNENFVLRNKLFSQKCASNLSEPCGKPSTVNNTPETRVHDVVGKIQAQWDLCLEERRKKYEQHTINNKFYKTRMSTKKMSILKADDKERADVACTSSNKTVGKTGASKKAFDNSQKQNHRSQNLTESKQSTSSPSKTIAKQHGNGSLKSSDKEDRVWKKGTVLIMGDSMLHGIDEKKMSKNGFVKVRCFPGSTISDLQWHYMQPLISKKPSTVVIHVGTNDAGIKGATADKIIDKLLELKKEIETKLPEATVVISTPLKRNDKVGAGQIIETLNKKIRSLGFSIVDNANIDSQDLGRKGLHLNARGVGKFAINLINKMRSF